MERRTQLTDRMYGHEVSATLGIKASRHSPRQVKGLGCKDRDLSGRASGLRRFT